MYEHAFRRVVYQIAVSLM